MVRRSNALVLVVLGAGCGQLLLEPASTDTGAGGTLEVAALQPPFLTTIGGVLEVELAGDRAGAVDQLEVDGVACPILERPSPTVVRCQAAPHVPAVVEVVARAGADRAAHPDGLIYLAAGPLQLGGAGDDRTSGLTVAADGSFFISGGTDGDLAGPPGGATDALLIHLDPAGQLRWARALATPAFDYAREVVIDPVTGDAVVAGTTGGALGPTGNAGGTDAFVARFGADGTLRWVTQIGGPADDEAWDLGVDGTGAVVVPIGTAGALPGQASAGGLDGAVAAVGPDGAVRWVTQFGTAADDFARAIAVAADGSSVVAGYTDGVLPPASGNAGGSDVFLARYDAAGALVWRAQRGGAGTDNAYDVVIDPAGRPSLIGMATASVDGEAYGGGGMDALWMRFTADGGWDRTVLRGGAGTDVVYGATTDADGTVYAAGATTAGFDGQPGAGAQDVLLLAWGSDGQHRLTRIAGGPATDSGAAVALDAGRTGLLLVPLITNGDLDGGGARGLGDIAVLRYEPTGVMR